jgi:hypothetical protein
MPEPDPMDVDAVLETLGAATALQQRSALETTIVAGSLTGVTWQPLAPTLWGFAAAELDDLRRLVEKVVALGGTPPAAPAPFEALTDGPAALRALVDHECEALAALHAVIPETGQEPRSEALEHRLEHVIMRKQEQVDTLRRVLGETGGDAPT